MSNELKWQSSSVERRVHQIFKPDLVATNLNREKHFTIERICHCVRQFMAAKLNIDVDDLSPQHGYVMSPLVANAIARFRGEESAVTSGISLVGDFREVCEKIEAAKGAIGISFVDLAVDLFAEMADHLNIEGHENIVSGEFNVNLISRNLNCLRELAMESHGIDVVDILSGAGFNPIGNTLAYRMMLETPFPVKRVQTLAYPFVRRTDKNGDHFFVDALLPNLVQERNSFPAHILSRLEKIPSANELGFGNLEIGEVHEHLVYSHHAPTVMLVAVVLQAIHSEFAQADDGRFYVEYYDYMNERLLSPMTTDNDACS